MTRTIDIELLKLELKKEKARADAAEAELVEIKNDPLKHNFTHRKNGRKES